MRILDGVVSEVGVGSGAGGSDVEGDEEEVGRERATWGGGGGGGTSLGCGLRWGELGAEWPTAGSVVSPSGGHLEGLGGTSLGGVGNEEVAGPPW